MNQGLSQRALPATVSLGTLAAAIPAGNAMPTAPRAGLAQAHLFRGRVQTHIAFQRTHLEAGGSGTVLDETRQKFITPGLMMTVKLTIGCYQDELSLACGRFVARKLLRQVMSCEGVGVIRGVPVEGDAT